MSRDADRRVLTDRFDRRVQIVGGKGGVGRTAVGCALALRSARQGKRTLLLEVDAPDSASAMLGVPPAIDEPRQVQPNLWLCRMTPVGALREYALMVLKFKALYNLVFENRMVKYLLRSIPSLGEFTMLGKTWFHAEEKLDGEPKYERIIVDAPATGHAITYLSVARIVADIAPKGIMKTASEKMAQMVESKEETCLHLVTLPEEMPVNEALDLMQAAKTKLRMSLGAGIVNRMLPPLASAEEREIIEQGRSPYFRAANLRLDREALQREYADRFAEKSGLPTIALYEYGDDFLERIVEALDA